MCLIGDSVPTGFGSNSSSRIWAAASSPFPSSALSCGSLQSENARCKEASVAMCQLQSSNCRVGLQLEAELIVRCHPARSAWVGAGEGERVDTAPRTSCSANKAHFVAKQQNSRHLQSIFSLRCLKPGLCFLSVKS